MADNVNIIVQDTINDIVVNAAQVVQTIDINMQAAVDVVDIVANPNNYVVNINRIIGEQVQSDWTQTDNQAPDYIKNKPTIPAAQVNSDWNATSGVAEILNKPSIPTATSDLTNDGEDGVHPFITAADVTAQVNSDWNATSGVAQILNKPSLATVATSGSYTDLSNKPTIPAAQVNSDWNATSGLAQILNKPTIPTNTSDLVNDGENGVDPFITAADVPNFTSVVKHIVKNNGLSGTITKGTAVYVTSSNGTNMLVGRASNASEATSSKTMGLMQTDITTSGANQTGYVVTEGLLEGLNTQSATAGDPVWLGVNGALIYGLTNKPYAPAHLVFIGIVTKVSAGNGEIFVKVQNGFELKEIHDVDLITNTPINGQVLGFDGTLWVNKTIASWLGFTPENVANKSTSTSLGTSDTLYPTQNAVKVYADTKFTLPALTSGSVLFSNGTTIAQDNSNLFWDDTNNRLGIGTATPAYGLDVNGTARVSGNTSINSGSELFSLGVVGRKPFRLFTSNGDKGCLRLERDGVINVNLSSDSAQFGASYISNTNFLVGTTTDAGFRLDVNGTARVSDISYLTLGARIGTTTTAAGIFPSGTSGRESLNLRSSLLPTDTGNDVVITNGQGDVANTSSIRSLLTVARSFSPTSGTGIYNLIQVNPTINQTGTATGITRGLYINPTLTAAADWRAIEASGRVIISDTSTVAGTNAASLLDLSQTWNTTGTPIAFKLNITDTASASLSDLMSLQVGGSARFRVLKSGYFVHNTGGEIAGSVVIGSSSINASSQLEVTSVTRGFLPPRMTTTQKNAIATPAAGLVVYDTTLNKLCVRTAAAWETITSL